MEKFKNKFLIMVIIFCTVIFGLINYSHASMTINNSKTVSKTGQLGEYIKTPKGSKSFFNSKWKPLSNGTLVPGISTLWSDIAMSSGDCLGHKQSTSGSVIKSCAAVIDIDYRTLKINGNIINLTDTQAEKVYRFFIIV